MEAFMPPVGTCESVRAWPLVAPGCPSNWNLTWPKLNSSSSSPIPRFWHHYHQPLRLESWKSLDTSLLGGSQIQCITKTRIPLLILRKHTWTPSSQHAPPYFPAGPSLPLTTPRTQPRALPLGLGPRVLDHGEPRRGPLILQAATCVKFPPGDPLGSWVLWWHTHNTPFAISAIFQCTGQWD